MNEPALLCLDIGSTFTKGVLVDPEGEVLGTAEPPTTLSGMRASSSASVASALAATAAAWTAAGAGTSASSSLAANCISTPLLASR